MSDTPTPSAPRCPRRKIVHAEYRWTDHYELWTLTLECGHVQERRHRPESWKHPKTTQCGKCWREHSSAIPKASPPAAVGLSARNDKAVATPVGVTAVDSVEDFRLPDINLVLGDKFADWGSTFGCAEFEDMAMAVVAFLRSEIPSKHPWLNMRGPTGEYAYERGEGWTKRFAIEDIGDCAIFAAMCAAGYFRHAWFPKWCFTVTDEFIARCPLACYQTRFSRDPKSGGCPNALNNYPEDAQNPATGSTPKDNE